MSSAQSIIEEALRKIQVLGAGSSLDATEAQQSLVTLNDMLASFSAEGAMIFQETKETFTLVSGQASYTIAAAGDFATTAPLYITAAYITQGDTDYPLSSVDERQYANIVQKDIQSSVPDCFYYDANYPTANIYLYPVPSTGTITLYSRKYLTAFTGLTDTFAMPAQYRAMLVHNLAIWLAPEYEREASPTVRRIAAKTKKTVMVQNDRNEDYVSEITGLPSRTESGNIYTGYYNTGYY